MEVSLSNVSFSYKNNNIFSDFSCCFSGGINAIVGSNGSGKSTLLDLIDGLLVPVSGCIKVGNIDIDSCRKRVGYLFQFSEEQIFNSTIYKEIEFGLKCFKCDDIDKCIHDSLDFVGLDDSFLNRNPYKISNGERRKVALASILCYKPDVIILDEPTVGLDNKSKNELMKLLKRLKNEFDKTIIIVSHDINFLHKFVDYVYLINNGKIVLEGDKYSVFSNEEVMDECGLIVPDVLHFSNLVYEKKGIKIGYRDEINDLIKDVYRYAKW
jgi:energy-coupling factor transport system ATP-binding protein